MKKENMVFTALLLIGAGLLLFFANSDKTADSASSATTQRGDTFSGQISNAAVFAGIVNGMGIYDRNCRMGADGFTSCDAGIQTEEYGVLNFKYRHNMAAQPCIAPNDLVQVRIMDSQGNAEVQKLE